ncbi:hypothetical protein [Sorangium sp. So ce1099]|uniref:hypothetical protein n=1 Tax=Sorangium sp. So ce1099 TaxID=3133331 RepID=UPI003F5D977C
MQHLFKVGISAVAMTAALMTACGETGVEGAEPAQGRAGDLDSSDETAAAASRDESGEAEALAGDEAATEDSAVEDGATEDVGSAQQALGKECNVSCTVQNLGSGECPPTVAGYGSTSFLGGCGKACRKAEGDAMSKLPPSCAIYTCDRSGC